MRGRPSRAAAAVILATFTLGTGRMGGKDDRGSARQREVGLAEALAARPGPQAQPSAFAVAFASPTVGWMVVSSSPTTEVLGTTDGGKSWRVEWEGPAYPGQLVVASIEAAYLTLHKRAGCSAGGDTPGWCATELVATGDGGKTWHEVWSSPLLLSYLAFSNPSSGLGALVPKPCSDTLPLSGKPEDCPGEVVRTTDGGRRWVGVLHTPGPVIALASSGPDRWWTVQAVPSEGYKLPPRSRVVVWASTEGGSAWARWGEVSGAGQLYLGPRAEATLTAEPGGRLWLSLVDPDSCAMHGCATLGAWYSADGGRTWAVTAFPVATSGGCGPGFGLPPLAKGANGAVYLGGGGGTAACPPTPTVVARWDGTGWAPVHSWGPASLTSMAWPSANSGFVVINGAVARTTDGGRSWSQSWPPLAPTGPLAPVSSATAVAGGDATDPGAVIATTDAGAAWATLARLPGDIETLDFPTAEAGFAVVNDPVKGTWELDTTGDGGSHWEVRGHLPVPAPAEVTTGAANGLWMASASRGLLLTSAGGVAPATLWSTANGGQTWAKAGAVPVPVSLSSASFAPSGPGSWFGWVEAGEAHPEVTSDGGRAWLTEPRFPLLNQVQALSKDVIVGWEGEAGVSATMWSSTDGGAHWASRPLPEGPYSPTSEDLAFANRAAGWWSEGGATWTTTDGGLNWAEATTSGVEIAPAAALTKR